MRNSLFILIFSFSISVVHCLPVKAGDTIQTYNVVGIGYDIIKPILMLTQNENDIKQYEMMLSFNTGKKINYSVDFGYADAYFIRKNYDLNLKGYYFKAGYDKQILSEGDDSFSYGLRLSGSRLKNNYINPIITDAVFGDIPVNIENMDLNAFWVEGLLKLDIRLIGNFSLGWTARLKVPVFIQKDDFFEPYYVPGFGKTLNGVMVGFNYYIIYKFPLKGKSRYN